MGFPKNPGEVNERNKKYHMLTFFDFLLIILIVILIAVIIIGMVIYKREATICMNNPLVYGVSQLQKQNNNEFVSCTCSKSSSVEKLYVTSSNVSVLKFGLN